MRRMVSSCDPQDTDDDDAVIPYVNYSAAYNDT